MAKYKVRRTLIVHADVTVIVEADSVAFDAIPSNIGNEYPHSGWRASVDVKPPSSVEVASKRLRATWIDHTDTAAGSKGRDRPKRIADAA